MKCPWFAGHFLTCFPLDFPRHIREVKPGADNSDLYLCGCNTVLAPVDPLHSQAEEGKNRQGWLLGCPGAPASPWQPFAHVRKFSPESWDCWVYQKKKNLFHFHSTKSARAQGVFGQHSQAHGLTLGTVLCKARN